MVVVFVAIIFLMMSIELASAASESDDTLPLFKFARRLLDYGDPPVMSYGLPPTPPYSTALNDEKP